jgi:hypothetical protein
VIIYYILYAIYSTFEPLQLLLSFLFGKYLFIIVTFSNIFEFIVLSAAPLVEFSQLWNAELFKDVFTLLDFIIFAIEVKIIYESFAFFNDLHQS